MNENNIHNDFMIAQFLLSFSVSFITVNILTRGSKRQYYSLKRKLSKQNIALDKIPESISSQNKLDKTGIKKDMSIAVNEFLKTFKGMDHVDLSNFYRNFHPYCIINTDDGPKIKGHIINRGLFNSDNNTISLYSNEKSVIAHELLHMASTYHGPFFLASGFQRTKLGFTYDEGEYLEYDIGSGLNEAYTELLTNRYFREDRKTAGYQNIYPISYIIERIVGKEKMESLYFRGDLGGLIEAFPKYIEKNEVMELLRNMDLFKKVFYDGKKFSRAVKREAYGNMILSAMDMAIKKIKDDLENDNVDVEFFTWFFDYWIFYLLGSNGLLDEKYMSKITDTLYTNFKDDSIPEIPLVKKP